MQEGLIYVQKQSDPKPYVPNAKATDILKGINRFFYLSPEQVNRRFWVGNNLTTAKAILKTLADKKNEYAETVMLHRGSDPRGKDSYIYRLGVAGLKHLRDSHESVPRRLRHTDFPKRDHLTHLLHVNDVLIAAELLERDQEAVLLTAFEHDRVLKSQPFLVTLHNGKMATLIPDSVMHFAYYDTADGTPEPHYVVLELDLGATRDYWIEKAEKYCSFLPAFQERYQSLSLTLAVVTPKGEQHMQNLRLWTQQVFTRLGMAKSSFAGSILFTGMDAATTDPTAFFLAPIWSPLYESEPISLLEVQNV